MLLVELNLKVGGKFRKPDDQMENSSERKNKVKRIHEGDGIIKTLGSVILK